MEALLERLRCGEEAAIEEAVQTYAAYVVAVIRRRGGGLLSPEDEEELASDVFLALWQNAGRIREDRLRVWLGRVAANKTVDRLRRQRRTLPLDEALAAPDDPLWQQLAKTERQAAVRAALETLSEEDRAIFHRFYDLRQTTNQIAAALSMRPSTVRTRLKRGRETLRQALCQRGITDENAI